MSDIIKAIILGIVEGITEFLPVSSTGHLILVNQFVTFSQPFTNMFDVVIQLGAILSVVVYFRKRLFPFGEERRDFFRSNTFDLWKKTIVGIIPAILIGGLFQEKIEEKLFNPIVVSVALIVWGIVLILIESKRKESKIDSIKNLSYLIAFSIGIIQCLAMVPGTSRSAATIIGAMLLGCSRVVAAEFSFFLAIPTMIGASGYTLYKMGLSLTKSEIIILSVGFIVSFLVALIVIRMFMDFISKNNFKPFGYYRVILGLIVILYFMFI